MSPGVLETNKSTNKKSPTDATSLDSLMNLAILVLIGSLVALMYIQSPQIGRGMYAKLFVSKPFVAMS